MAIIPLVSAAKGASIHVRIYVYQIMGRYMYVCS